jgi:hypothetical protein
LPHPEPPFDKPHFGTNFSRLVDIQTCFVQTSFGLANMGFTNLRIVEGAVGDISLPILTSTSLERGGEEG